MTVSQARFDGPGKLSRTPLAAAVYYGAGRVRGPRGLQAGLEPGPGNVGPGAAVGVRCTDRGGGGQGEHGMGLGNGGPHAGSGLAVALAE